MQITRWQGRLALGLALWLLLIPLAQLWAMPHCPAVSDQDPGMGQSLAPCHAQNSNPEPAPCPHCDQTGMALDCDCCQSALSPSLPTNISLAQNGLTPAISPLPLHIPTHPTPSQSPLYRPPIA